MTDFNEGPAKCPTCGSVPCPPDVAWQPTSELRVIPDGEETIISGEIPVGGLFPRRERVSLTGRTVPRFRYERMFVRTWAEREWREDGR